MNNENIEEEVAELTPEELFEQHKAEIDALFEEKGFFRRLSDMFKGLGEPKSSREYKIARVELQRLMAPLIAILVPVLGVIILIVVTAVSAQKKDIVQLDIARPQDDVQELTDEVEPEPEEIDMTQDVDVSVEVSTDMPAPSQMNPAPPSPNPGGEPDKVAAVPSPVTMASVAGTVKMRGIGDGDGGGFGTLVGGGGGQNVEGCLIGVILALNRDSEGKVDSSYNQNRYRQSIAELTKANFSTSARAKYYSPNKKVALTHVNIPEQDRRNGPKAFGVEKDIKPEYWAIYYTGTLKPVEKARYRFVGYFDEAMVVKLNNKVVYESYWGLGPQAGKNEPGPYTGWVSSDTSLVGKWQSPQGNSKLVVGDWFNAEPGKPIKMDLLIGEFGGGKVGGILLIQKEGVKYNFKNGHPILPIFCSRPLSYKEKERLSSDGYGISVDSPKFFGRLNKKDMEKMTKDDVSVEVDI